MTQAALASDDFTKGFISQLETGRTKLSLRAAQIFAARLGVSVGDLLRSPGAAEKHLEVALLQAERELADGSAQLALKLAREARPGGRLLGRSLRLQGRALLALDRAAEGVRLLERALESFRAERQRDSYLRTLYDLAFAHARLDRPEQALVLALECASALRSGELVDRTFELQIESFLAATYARLGDFGEADAHVERAEHLAQDVVNRDALAALHARLATMEQERGNLDLAIEHWQRSLRELEHLGRERAVADTWHNLATAHLRKGELAKATRALDKAERLGAESHHERLGAWLKLTRAKVALRGGQLGRADRLASDALTDTTGTALARSEALLVRAEVLDRKRAPLDQVRRAFDAALSALRTEPAGVRVRALRLYADALVRRGEIRAGFEKAREGLDLISQRR
jgi:tetratricopeptide (TPR) repeat protein